tara:strand:+ start:501 stop:644 length:144 start_codon:yes stop_codon:yes gene_type:complete
MQGTAPPGFSANKAGTLRSTRLIEDCGWKKLSGVAAFSHFGLVLETK